MDVADEDDDAVADFSRDADVVTVTALLALCRALELSLTVIEPSGELETLVCAVRDTDGDPVADDDAKREAVADGERDADGHAELVAEELKERGDERETDADGDIEFVDELLSVADAERTADVDRCCDAVDAGEDEAPSDNVASIVTDWSFDRVPVEDTEAVTVADPGTVTVRVGTRPVGLPLGEGESEADALTVCDPLVLPEGRGETEDERVLAELRDDDGDPLGLRDTVGVPEARTVRVGVRAADLVVNFVRDSNGDALRDGSPVRETLGDKLGRAETDPLDDGEPELDGQTVTRGEVVVFVEGTAVTDGEGETLGVDVGDFDERADVDGDRVVDTEPVCVTDMLVDRVLAMVRDAVDSGEVDFEDKLSRDADGDGLNPMLELTRKEAEASGETERRAAVEDGIRVTDGHSLLDGNPDGVPVVDDD